MQWVKSTVVAPLYCRLPWKYFQTKSCRCFFRLFELQGLIHVERHVYKPNLPGIVASVVHGSARFNEVICIIDNTHLTATQGRLGASEPKLVASFADANIFFQQKGRPYQPVRYVLIHKGLIQGQSIIQWKGGHLRITQHTIFCMALHISWR